MAGCHHGEEYQVRDVGVGTGANINYSKSESKYHVEHYCRVSKAIFNSANDMFLFSKIRSQGLQLRTRVPSDRSPLSICMAFHLRHLNLFFTVRNTK